MTEIFLIFCKSLSSRLMICFVLEQLSTGSKASTFSSRHSRANENKNSCYLFEEKCKKNQLPMIWVSIVCRRPITRACCFCI